MVAANIRLYELTKSATYKNDVIAAISKQISGSKTAGGLLRVDAWGSLRHAANAAFIARVAVSSGIVSSTSDVSIYLTFAKKQLDYILGSNPAGRSYVCGFGTNYPKNPHHRSAHDSPNANIANPATNAHTLFGALVGGPYYSDTDFSDDRADYVKGEVATDYNALYTGLLASFTNTEFPAITTVDLTTTCSNSAAPTTATAAPPTSNLGYVVSLDMLTTEWIQVSLNKACDGVTFAYNGYGVMCEATGPQWGGNHYTCAPSPAVNLQKGLVAYVKKGSSMQRVVLKEGSVSVSLLVSDPVSTFNADTFVVSVSSSLGLDDATRISVDAVSSVSENSRTFRGRGGVNESTVVEFRILPLPPVYYTTRGATKLAEYAEAHNLTNTTGLVETKMTTFVKGQLENVVVNATNNETGVSPMAASLLQSVGGVSDSLTLTPQPAAPEYPPATSPSSNPESNPATTTAPISAVAVCVVVGAALGVLVHRRRSARLAVNNYTQFLQEDHTVEMDVTHASTTEASE